MLTAEQLQARKRGIGGSDAATVMGLNPYASPLDLYNNKLGLVPDPDLSDNQAVHFGNVLEDVVAQEYERRTGNKVRRRNQQFQHKQHSWMLANIDRSVDGQRKVLECKTAGAFFNRDEWGPAGTDLVPAQYLIQCAHYMAVLDYDSADLAVLIGGRDFRVYHIQRDAELEKMLIQAEEKFWHEHVLQEVPPEPSTESDVVSSFPKDSGEAVTATPDVVTHINRLRQLKTEAKALEEQVKAEELAIKKAMADASVLVDSAGNKLATWTCTKPVSRFDSKAFQKACPDVYKQYLKESSGSRRFSVK